MQFFTKFCLKKTFPTSLFVKHIDINKCIFVYIFNVEDIYLVAKTDFETMACIYIYTRERCYFFKRRTQHLLYIDRSDGGQIFRSQTLKFISRCLWISMFFRHFKCLFLPCDSVIVMGPSFKCNNLRKQNICSFGQYTETLVNSKSIFELKPWKG